MKIFSKHRKKIDPYRRFGSREFKEKLTTAKNYKRLGAEKSFDFFSKTGLSRVGTVTGIAVLAVIFYFLVLSPYFLVKNIVIKGNSRVSASEISKVVAGLSEKRFLLVPQNSLLALNQGRLNNLFKEKLPEVREVKSKRSWPNKITIEISERTPALSVVVSGKNYTIDDQGFVMKETPKTEVQLKIIDQVDEEIKVGEVIGGKLIPFIISMQKQWPGKINVPLAMAKIPGKGASETEFVSAEGWSAFFSTDRPVVNQLSNLSILLNNLTHKGEKPKLVYIDLRLAKWAYYCLRSTPCQQTDQSALPQTASGTKVLNTVEPTEDIQEKDQEPKQ
jgi:hypothetical protein